MNEALAAVSLNIKQSSNSLALWMLKLAITVAALLLVWQVPFLLRYTSDYPIIFGRYSWKYLLLLILYLLICRGILAATWHIWKLTPLAHEQFRDRLDPYAGWVIAFMLALPIGIYAGWAVFARSLPGVLVGRVYWAALLSAAVTTAAALLIPQPAYRRMMIPMERLQTAAQRLTEGRAGRLLMILGIVLALIPPVIMASRAIPFGEQALSNDIMDWIPFISRILDGSYDWTHYFRDTLLNGHPLPIIGLVHLANAALFHWNHQALLIEAFILGGILSWLFTLILSASAPSIPRWVILPLVTLLLYMPVHLAVYSFGFGGTQIPLVTIGFVLGVWALARFSITWKTIGIMIGAGFLAAWSGVQGYFSWPLYVIALAITGDRKPAHYAVLIACAALSALPLIPTLASPDPSIRFSLQVPSPEALIWVFYHIRNHPARMEGLGGICFMLLIFAALLTVPRFLGCSEQRQIRQRIVYPWMLIVYGLISMLLVLFFRWWGLVPWYSMIFVIFWIGIAGLAFAYLDQFPALQPPGAATLSAIWAGVALAMILDFALTTRLADDDYMFLGYRTPVSSSCWRHYATAPDTCEQQVTFRTLGKETWRERAAMLEKHHLSVFAPHQRWALQGDLGMTGTSSAIWSPDGLPTSKTNPHDYHYLNLLIRPSDTITWEVSFPANTEQAILHTAVGISPASTSAQPMTFQIAVEADGEQAEILFVQEIAAGDHGWREVGIPLNAYIGKSVRLSFSVLGDSKNWGMFRYPYLDVTIDE